MSAAAASPTDGAALPAKKGKKKLLIMIVAVLLLVLGGGGGAAIYFKKKAAAAEEAGDEGGAAAEHKSAKRDPKHPPVFLPLDPFVVNLADKEADRYAQIGITLELQDAKFGDELKLYMPAIRNGILMILAHKTSAELLDRSGKEMLAQQVQREAARTMGIDVAEPDPVSESKPAAKHAATDEGDDEVEAKPKKKKSKKAATEPNPILQVHFSNFIIQ